MKRYLILLLTALLLAGCASSPVEDASTPPPSPPAEEDQSAFAPVIIPEPEPDPRQETIDELLASMTVEEKIYLTVSIKRTRDTYKY